MLILAQLLKANAPAYRTLPTDPEGKRSYAIQSFQEFIQDHFIREEQHLLPALEFKNDALSAIAREMRTEHAQLIEQFAALLSHAESDLEAALDQLGYDLETHIRKEEREWFMLVQKTLSPEEMEALELGS